MKVTLIFQRWSSFLYNGCIGAEVFWSEGAQLSASCTSITDSAKLECSFWRDQPSGKERDKERRKQMFNVEKRLIRKTSMRKGDASKQKIDCRLATPKLRSQFTSAATLLSHLCLPPRKSLPSTCTHPLFTECLLCQTTKYIYKVIKKSTKYIAYKGNYIVSLKRDSMSPQVDFFNYRKCRIWKSDIK